jgi:capsular polysaccharide transport system ATP-binding protein
MISLDRVSHDIVTGAERRQFLRAVTVNIPPDRHIALLGATDEDRLVLFEILSGVVLPKQGLLIRKGNVSFPVGYLGGISGDLSVRQNVEHIARIYGADVHKTTDIVERLANLGGKFDRPFEELSKVERRQLAPIVALSIPFDLYLLSAGRKGSQNPSLKTFYSMFHARASGCGMIIATDPIFARAHCNMGMVVRNGGLHLFDDVEEAIAFSGKVQHQVSELYDSPSERARASDDFDIMT